MHPRIESLAAECRPRRMGRRVFLQRLSAIVSYPLAHHLESTSRAAALLSQAEAAGTEVNAVPVKYPGHGATLAGYLSKPQGTGPFPALIVIHASRGLNEHIRDVARRFVAEGFVALALDQLSRKGGSASFAAPDAARQAMSSLADDQVLADLDAAYQYLVSHVAVRSERTGVVGFGWGGQRAFLYAAANAQLKAAAVFYGAAPPEEQLAKINCPVLGIYGEADVRLTPRVPATAELMKKHGKSFDPQIYPGAACAFFNDAGPHYNAAAAQDAWARTLAFFRHHLN